MNNKLTLLLVLFLLFTDFTIQAQKSTNKVKIVGQMKDVMWKGQLSGVIKLDTIANKHNLYGLGPVEFLTGEVLIVDGITYVSRVTSDTTMNVDEAQEVKAPFFGYANISNWSEQVLTDTIQTIQQLEAYLDNLTQNAPRPFFFKLEGTVEEAILHIVNLPKGSKVTSPEEAHKGQVNYKITNEDAVIIGFFSTEHKAIFTHHSTFLHLHLITADKKKMGHLDEVLFKNGTMKLYLPAN